MVQNNHQNCTAYTQPKPGARKNCKSRSRLTKKKKGKGLTLSVWMNAGIVPAGKIEPTIRKEKSATF